MPARNKINSYCRTKKIHTIYVREENKWLL